MRRLSLIHISLLAGINSSEFRFREADFGQFPKGLLYGIQCLDSWLFDDMQPFMHLEALDTYQFLKDQIGTGYYEELVKTYLLDNPHASVVITVPEQGLGAKRDAALEKKLAEYKAGLSREERKKLIADTKHLKQYQDCLLYTSTRHTPMRIPYTTHRRATASISAARYSSG